MLDGKAVIITGAGRGIGAACARGVARQGASVMVNDVGPEAAATTVQDIRAAGGEAEAFVADIADWDGAGRLVAACVDAFGGLDGLVNNAALFHMAGIADFDPQVARALVEVNVLGTMHCTAHAVRHMLPRGKGSIVNVVSGAHMGMRNMGIYGATKGAVASMVYTWALELAGTGVRINALSPFGATNLIDNSNEYLRNRFGDQAATTTITGSSAALPPTDQNAPVVEYLLSDESADVNGQLVRMDRGELQLYTHPALLLPSIRRDDWDARAVADAFETDLKQRQVGCGVLGMESLPVPLTSGFWARAAEADGEG